MPLVLGVPVWWTVEIENPTRPLIKTPVGEKSAQQIYVVPRLNMPMPCILVHDSMILFIDLKVHRGRELSCISAILVGQKYIQASFTCHITTAIHADPELKVGSGPGIRKYHVDLCLTC